MQQLQAANTKTAETGTRRRKIRNYSNTRKGWISIEILLLRT